MKFKSLLVLLAFLVAAAAEAQIHRLRKQQHAMQHTTNSIDPVDSLESMFRDESLLWGRDLQEDSLAIFGMSMSMGVNDESAARSSCVAPDVPEFLIDGNENIGDTLFHPGPGFAKNCGPDCYTVKDSGDDPPYDPEEGDTARFAYKKVSSDNFSIQSRACGTACHGNNYRVDGQYGRTGLMVRETLDDPFGKNIFASHSPNGQADWSWRIEPDAETIFGFDGSPDVPCLWITLERDGNQFTFSYAYEGDDECELSGEFLEDLTQTVTIEMPQEVFVGLAVSTGVAPPYCQYTEADFNDIECRGCVV